MQEHAEGPRSRPIKMCHHCGARIAPDAKECPKCGAAQADHPSRQQPGEKDEKD